MQIIRTVFWVVLTAILVAFIAMNWTRVPVNIWPVEGGNYLHFEWPVGVIALVFFVAGALPMWLVHRAGRWRLNRRIHSLENTVASTAAPVATSPVVASHEPGAVTTTEPLPHGAPLADRTLDDKTPDNRTIDGRPIDPLP